MPKFRIILYGALLLSLLVSGCQTTTGYYKGASANKMNVVELTELQSGEHHWQDLYLDIDYRVERNDDRLTIDGQFGFSLSSKTIFQQVHDMKVILYLLDGEMKVLDYWQLGRSLGSDIEQTVSFKKSVPLTEQAAALTFGYDGLMVDDEKRVEMVWRIPEVDR